jgi:hypothetical protein
MSRSRKTRFNDGNVSLGSFARSVKDAARLITILLLASQQNPVMIDPFTHSDPNLPHLSGLLATEREYGHLSIFLCSIAELFKPIPAIAESHDKFWKLQ